MQSVLPAVDEYLIELLRSCINDTQPCDKPTEVSWQELFERAKQNSVVAAAYNGMSRLNHCGEDTELQRGSKSHNMRLVACINQTLECEKLLQELERRKLRALPVKGYWLRQMYPRPELREMGDIDILVDDDRSEQTRQMMAELGYQYTGCNVRHTNYCKKPYVEIELHKQLLLDDSIFAEIFNDPWDRTLEVPGYSYLRRFSWEDYYLFLLAHFVKHYRQFGCGIRHILDIYVFLRAYGETLDWTYIRQNLEAHNLWEFTQTAMELAKTWFQDGNYDEKQLDMAKKLFNSGCYGNMDTYDANRIAELTPKGKTERSGRRVYFCKMLFPPYAEMEELFPVLRKASFLLPVFWIYRGLRSVFRLNRVRYYYRRAMKK